MARERLTDYEVGIIKNLIGRELENRVIAGMINLSRGVPEKHISAARVTDIKKGTTKRYVPIEIAADADTEQFIEQYGRATRTHDPVAPAAIDQKFSLTPDGKGLAVTETEFVECKEGLSVPLKTIAAMANNKGGYIVFGVKNGTWAIVGLKADKRKNFDLNRWNQKIRGYFGIGISLDAVERLYKGKTVLFLHIGEAHTKPVITLKNGDGLQDGAIYYRYPGEDRLITALDLQKLLDERVRKRSELVIQKYLVRILEIGPDNAAIVDLNSGKLEGKSGSIMIDEDTLKNISFIREGEFVESGGKPTLRLVGDVEKITDTIIKEKDLLELYPIGGKELLKLVKKQVPEVTQRTFYELLSKHRVRENSDYAAYPFRSEQQRQAYKQRGKVPNGISAIYNESAVNFIVGKLKSDATK